MFTKYDDALVWGNRHALREAKSLRKRGTVQLMIGVSMTIIGLVILGSRFALHMGNWSLSGLLVIGIGLMVAFRHIVSHDKADLIIAKCLEIGTAIKVDSFSYSILWARLMETYELNLTDLLESGADYDRHMAAFTGPASRLEQKLANPETSEAVARIVKADVRKLARMTAGDIGDAFRAKTVKERPA